MTSATYQTPAVQGTERAEAGAGRAASSALLPLVLDLAVPLGGYYLLQHFGVSMVLSLAISGALPALRTGYRLLREHRVEPLALFTLGVTAISLPVALITGSARFMLAKESIGTGPLGICLIVSALLGKPVMAAAFRAFAARTTDTARAWEHLVATSPEFRRCLKNATLVWGIGFLIEFALRLVVVFGLPVSTAVWATSLPMIACIVLCIGIAGRWTARIGELVKETAQA